MLNSSLPIMGTYLAHWDSCVDATVSWWGLSLAGSAVPPELWHWEIFQELAGNKYTLTHQFQQGISSSNSIAMSLCNKVVGIVASSNLIKLIPYSVTTKPFARYYLLEKISPTIQGNGHLLDQLTPTK